MRDNRLPSIGRAFGLGLCLLAASSCTSAVRDSRASSYLIINELAGASGAKPDTFSTVLQSDVQTKGGIFEDFGRMTCTLAIKDPTLSTGLTSVNFITLTQYHVEFVRSDGRNTPGVDVPYAFDGAATGTVDNTTPLSLVFVLVRAQAKDEAPLRALRGQGGSFKIDTIARVTFYGHDQAGNGVSVTGQISIGFTDFADPA